MKVGEKYMVYSRPEEYTYVTAYPVHEFRHQSWTRSTRELVIPETGETVEVPARITFDEKGKMALMRSENGHYLAFFLSRVIGTREFVESERAAREAADDAARELEDRRRSELRVRCDRVAATFREVAGVDLWFRDGSATLSVDDAEKIAALLAAHEALADELDELCAVVADDA